MGAFFMAVRKLTTGKWLCECYPAGRSGRRVRKQFATKGEALAFERYTHGEIEAKPWLGESVDRRTLKDMVELWFKLHGKISSAGQHVYNKLLLMVDALGNPCATDLTSKCLLTIEINAWQARSTSARNGRKEQARSPLTWSKAI